MNLNDLKYIQVKTVACFCSSIFGFIDAIRYTGYLYLWSQLNKSKINLKIKGHQLQLRVNCYPYHRNNKVIFTGKNLTCVDLLRFQFCLEYIKSVTL